MKPLATTTGLALLLCAASASAQTGVSDNRVSLPDGPGSLEGIGDDASVTGNMGAMAYGVSMSAPPGYAGLTPSLGLSYSSASGAGIAGMGWSMPMPSIERLTVRGVPDYDLEDEFTADSGQLVYVGGTNPREYRSRFEGAFVRYRWYDPGAGDGGHWTAEFPDGRVGTYGADLDGDAVGAARVGGDAGVFRYLLVDMTDVWGHRLHHEWAEYGGTTLLSAMHWVFDGDTPTYEATFTYEPREDVVLDGTGGFVESLGHRLTSVETFASGTSVDRWDLTYEAYDASGGFSRLQSVQRYGVGGEAYPIAASLGYSSALGEICDGVSCERPFVRSLGNIGVNIATGDPQLVDINGDALPDIVDSTLTGAPHRIFVNTVTAGGDQFFAAPYDSAVGAQDGFDFSNARVQMLDVDGDGFTDAANLATGEVLRNEGTGDWIVMDEVDTVALPDFENPSIFETLRFVDIDNDRRIDLLRASGSGASHSTQIYRNTGTGYVELGDAEPLGRGFDSDTLEVNDFNGDGLVDAVQVAQTGVRYRLNLGHGQWWPAEDWAFAEFDGDGLEASQTVDAELEDLNGDGLADVVLVQGTTVQVWVNRAGTMYEALDPITDDDVDGVDGASIPSNTATTTVLFADVNANGSSDVVWVTAAGDVTALELFPVRPNLLSTIENGLGVTTRVEYGTSVEQMARDAGTDLAWTNPLPFANLVVTATSTEDGPSGLGWRTEYAYHDGFYDGVEKQFRGYRLVARTVIGDETQLGSTTTEEYALGVEDPYAAGPMVAASVVDATGAPLHDTTIEYDFCPLDVDDTGLLWPIRFLCPVETESVLQDGADASEWITTRETSTYDAYGNVTLAANYGTVAIGGSATCAPCDREAGEYGLACGTGCLGDETFATATYIEPGDATGGAWILGRASRTAQYGDEALTDLGAEAVYHYDGDAFVGLDEGQLTRGIVTRSMARVDDDRWVATQRLRFDDHGNIIESLAPEADVDGVGQRVRYAYSSDGLVPASTEIELDATSSLRRDYVYEPLRRQMEEASQWYRPGTSDAQVFSRLSYDAFGRLVAQVLPGGDTFATPSVQYTYAFDDDGGRVLVQSRDVPGGAWTLQSVVCSDGYGRRVSERVAIEDGRWLVTGTTVYGRAGRAVRTVANYESTTGECVNDAPDGLAQVEYTYDGQGRLVRTLERSADGQERESASVFAPGQVRIYDGNDLDPDHPHFDTPELRTFDGLGRPASIGRVAERGGTYDHFDITWDASSNLVRLTDPHGNSRVQRFDLLGRIVEAADPDRGVNTWVYDDNGDVVAATDPTGTVRSAYDGAGRLVETWVDGDRESTLQTVLWDSASDCPDGRCTFGINRPVGVRAPTSVGEVTQWRGYDVLGNTIWTRLEMPSALGDVRPLERRWTYDQLGTAVDVRFVGDVEATFAHDGARRPIALSGIIDAIRYDELGHIDRIDAANGTSSAYERDAFGRIARQTVTGSGGATLFDLSWQWDAGGNVLAVVDGIGDGREPGWGATYTWDGFNRLVAAELDAGTPWAESITWSYDAIDNLTARTSSLGAESPIHEDARTIDAAHPHRVTRFGGQDVSYDAAGRVTARGDIRTTWDGFGSLGAVDDGETIHTYSYMLGRRIVEDASDGSLTLRLGDELEIRDGVASVLIEVGSATVARFEYAFAPSLYADLAPARASGDGAEAIGDDAIGAGDAWLAWADARSLIDIDVVESSAADVDRSLSAAAAAGLIDQGDRVIWHYRDGLGSLALVTDIDGDVVEKTLYYPFGHERFTSTQSGDPLGFTEMVDGAGRTIAFPLRDYDPLMGRWLKPDVLFETLSADELTRPWEAFGAYSYVANRPVAATDPNGANLNDGLAIGVNDNNNAQQGGDVGDMAMNSVFGLNDDDVSISDSNRSVSLSRQSSDSMLGNLNVDDIGPRANFADADAARNAVARARGAQQQAQLQPDAYDLQADSDERNRQINEAISLAQEGTDRHDVPIAAATVPRADIAAPGANQIQGLQDSALARSNGASGDNGNAAASMQPEGPADTQGPPLAAPAPPAQAAANNAAAAAAPPAAQNANNGNRQNARNGGGGRNGVMRFLRFRRGN